MSRRIIEQRDISSYNYFLHRESVILPEVYIVQLFLVILWYDLLLKGKSLIGEKV